MSTDAARKMLEAAGRRPCGHGSFYTCAHCEGRIHAQVWFESSGFTPNTLRVAIGAVEALEHEHQKQLDLPLPEDADATPEDEEDHRRIAQEFREGKRAEGCYACDALTEWEKLSKRM